MPGDFHINDVSCRWVTADQWRDIRRQSSRELALTPVRARTYEEAAFFKAAHLVLQNREASEARRREAERVEVDRRMAIHYARSSFWKRARKLPKYSG